jgi:hypothetical protein
MPLFQFLFLEQIDVEITLRSPLGPGDVSEPGRAQHQRRVTVRERRLKGTFLSCLSYFRSHSSKSRSRGPGAGALPFRYF